MTDIEPESAELVREWQAAAPKRRASPEHALQVAIVKTVREVVDTPHRFFGFDRSRPQSQFQHMREKARGIAAGCPDTVLVCTGRAIWCELKAPGKKPTDDQLRVGQEIADAGGRWHWVSSVQGYVAWLRFCGVPLRPNADVVALHRDAALASPAAKARAPAKPKAEKASAARIRRVGAVRSKVVF